MKSPVSLVFLLLLAALVFPWFLYSRKKAQVDSAEAEAKRIKEDAVRIAKMVVKYNGADFRKIYNVPANLTLSKDLVPVYAGSFEPLPKIYVTSTGHRYHDKSCWYSRYGVPGNLWEVSPAYACSKCSPPMYDFSWYYKFRKDRSFLSSYGISMKLNGVFIIISDSSQATEQSRPVPFSCAIE